MNFRHLLKAVFGEKTNNIRRDVRAPARLTLFFFKELLQLIIG
jgi:hypothetical protein